MKRYHLIASFKIEERKGFPVTHQIDFETDSHEELNQKVLDFTMSYNHEYCHSMNFVVTEQNMENVKNE